MDFVYKKNTLYVYMQGDGSSINRVTKEMESKINYIMGSYEIDNLVIDTNGLIVDNIYEFESRYNTHHNSKVIIR